MRPTLSVVLMTAVLCGCQPDSTLLSELEVGAPSTEQVHAGGPQWVTVAVAAGDDFTCAIRVDLRAYCWGANSRGQLGSRASAQSGLPVTTAGNHRFVTVTASGQHACALTPQGEAWCWGWNAFGQLGDGTTANSDLPVRVAGDIKFVAIDAGPYHTCGITRAGVAFCWGANGPLQRQGPRGSSEGYALGAASAESCDNPLPLANGGAYRGTPWPCSTTPLRVSGGLAFRSISAGLWSSCAITQDDAAYCWGWNAFDQLGTGVVSDATAPTRVTGDLLFRNVAAGSIHSCGVSGGDAYCWGNFGPLGGNGSLGTGTFAGSSAPARVVGGAHFGSVTPSDANDVFAFTCGLTTDGSAYCWGMNRFGQLGTDAPLATCALGPSPCSNVPVAVSGNLTFTALALGREFTCGLTRRHTLYCWGRNESGQLGDGTQADRSTPVAVLSPEQVSANVSRGFGAGVASNNRH